MVEDIRRALMEGLRSVPSVRAVVTGQAAQLPFFVVDSAGEDVELVSECLRDLTAEGSIQFWDGRWLDDPQPMGHRGRYD